MWNPCLLHIPSFHPNPSLVLFNKRVCVSWVFRLCASLVPSKDSTGVYLVESGVKINPRRSRWALEFRNESSSTWREWENWNSMNVVSTLFFQNPASEQGQLLGHLQCRWCAHTEALAVEGGARWGEVVGCRYLGKPQGRERIEGGGRRQREGVQRKKNVGSSWLHSVLVIAWRPTAYSIPVESPIATLQGSYYVPILHLRKIRILRFRGG